MRQGFDGRDRHSKGANFRYVDRRIDEFRSIDGGLLRALLTINGGEVRCIEKL